MSPFKPATFTLPSTAEQVAYLAGVFDGEGALTQGYGNWRVQIAMTYEPLIRWLEEMGGRVDLRPIVGNRQQLYRWLLIRQRDVEVFLIGVRPYLRVKAEKADEVLALLSERLAA